jgi:hypothetical protein
MTKAFVQLLGITAAILSIAVLPQASQAGDEEGPQPSEEGKGAGEIKAQMKKDQTGTNPLNFTFDARLYNEYQWLNTAGDGGQNITTLEFRAPLGDGKWQFRGKIRGQGLKADLDNDGIDDVDEYAMGDTDLRFMTIPYLTNKMGVAPGIELLLPTATDPSLGSGAWTLAPFTFLAFFNPLGPGSIFIPGYQHFISLDEDPGRSRINRGLIDLFLVKTFADNQFWAYIDPQVILDYENSDYFAQIELQAGAMLDKLLGTKGHSVWVMPSFGVGADRPYDYSLEVGYKFVWR